MSITSDRSDTTVGTTITETRRPRQRSHRALLGWGAVAAACLAAGALAVATLAGDGDAPPAPVVPAHPGIVANGSPRAIDGSVEDRLTVPAGPGIAENGSPRAIDGTVEGRMAPTAEATGSNVEDMPPVADRGTPGTTAVVTSGADEQPPVTPSPLVSRRDPPM
jgi:hypothetical protein